MTVSTETYHAALSFETDADGKLRAACVEPAPTPLSAVLRARRLARSAKGAVAFSRSADMDRGIYSDPIVHTAIGELPDDIRVYVPPL
jgi:hypothetical protein